MEELTNRQWIEIGVAFGASVVLGWLIRQLLLPFLLKLSKRTKWRTDDLVLESVSKWVVFWFFLGAAVYVLPMLTGTYDFARRNELLIKNIIGALFILSFTMVIARIVAGLLQIRGERHDHELASTSILGNIVRAIVYCIGLILILQTFGVAIAPLLTALGVGGIAVALALQPTLSNLFSGLQLIASGKINIGDLVRLEGGQMGTIRDITWRNTTIETWQQVIIVVPNSKMADSIIENFLLFPGRFTFNTALRVALSSDLQKVERIAVEVAKEVLKTSPGGKEGFEPPVRFQKFGETAVDFTVGFEATVFGDQFLIISNFLKAVQERFRQEGIEIPSAVQPVLFNKMG